MQPLGTEMGRSARRSTPPQRGRTPSTTPRTGAGSRAHACENEAGIDFAGALLLACDFACLAVAAWASTTPHAPLATAAPAAIGPARAIWMAAVLAPFVLYDRRFGSGPLRLGSHGLRFALFGALALLLGWIGQILQAAPPAWLATFFALGFLSTSFTRILLARWMLHLQRNGPLTEVVAIVGAGPLADRLVQQLHRLHPDTTEVLGIFDDDPGAASGGTVSQLIELGSTRRIDWIVLALPPGSELNSHVQRLMALAVPIALCPQHLGLAPDHPVGYLAGSIPAILLVDQPLARRDAFLHAIEEFVPRWVITWMRLALEAASALAKRYALGTARHDAPRQDTPRQDAPHLSSLRSPRLRPTRQPLPRSPAARDSRPAPATLPPL